VIKNRLVLSLALVLGSGCGPGVHMTYLDTSSGSADTGEIGTAYEDVDGLVDCLNGAFIRLPRTSEDVNDTVDVWSYNELRTIAYDDAEADRGFGGFFPVIFVGEGEDPIDREEGWYVDGTVDTNYDNGG